MRPAGTFRRWDGWSVEYAAPRPKVPERSASTMRTPPAQPRRLRPWVSATPLNPAPTIRMVGVIAYSDQSVIALRSECNRLFNWPLQDPGHGFWTRVYIPKIVFLSSSSVPHPNVFPITRAASVSSTSNAITLNPTLVNVSVLKGERPSAHGMYFSPGAAGAGWRL